MRLRAEAILPSVLLAAGCFAHDYRSGPRVAVVDGDPIVQMSAPQRFPSLEGPRFVAVDHHSDPPFDDEKVLGLSLGATPRMYPIGLLDSYEVINDEDGGVPYVVARCALTNLVAVFDRRIGGSTLTFENSGALWRDMLVLRDRETGTYWTPATGRALSGPLAGEALSALPAALTTAEAWRELQPATSCLETGDLTAVPLRLRLYGASSWEGVSGEKTKDRRYRPKEQMFFVGERGEALAFTASLIRERKKVESRLADHPVTIEWDPALRAPRAWSDSPSARRELPVVPIYWFALLRHFTAIRMPS